MWGSIKTWLAAAGAVVLSIVIAVVYGMRKGATRAKQAAQALRDRNQKNAANEARKTQQDATDAMLDIESRPEKKPDTDKRDDFENHF